jgi:diguanylate cyclase (GGDEF)-like protein
MNAPSKEVLVVASDRARLRHVSRFLELFGYQARQATEKQQATAALQAIGPEVLIVDGESTGQWGLELCRELRGTDILNDYVYSIWMDPGADTAQLVQALEAGFDDFLQCPLVAGELLARLRAGADVVRYERRARLQTGTDSLTGLPGHGSFHELARKEIQDLRRRKKKLACVALDLDVLDGINWQFGRPAGDMVLRSVARLLERLCAQGQRLGRLCGGQFCVLLPQTSPEQALEWVERVRTALSRLELGLSDENLKVTTSVGVASLGSDMESAEQLIEAALAALCDAHWSGRDCVVTVGEFDSETASWKEEAAPAHLFESTLARDVMRACPVWVTTLDSISQIGDLLSEATTDALPLVDPQGEIVGLLRRETLDSDPDNVAYGTAADLDIKPVESFDELTPFAGLFQFFIDGSASEVVITAEGIPSGIITRQALADLIQPVTQRTGDDNQSPEAMSRQGAAIVFG